jgi:DNA-binding CsgD family transcriptional regulator
VTAVRDTEARPTLPVPTGPSGSPRPSASIGPSAELGALPGAALVVDAAGTVVAANAAAAELLGTPQSELVGQPAPSLASDAIVQATALVAVGAVESFRTGTIVTERCDGGHRVFAATIGASLARDGTTIHHLADASGAPAAGPPGEAVDDEPTDAEVIDAADVAVVLDEQWGVVASDGCDDATHGAFTWIHPDDAGAVGASYVAIVLGRSTHAELTARTRSGRGWVPRTLRLQRLHGPGARLVLVTTAPASPATTDAARLGDLERRLHRIGVEVREAGVFDRERPMIDRARAMPELVDLTERQWDILARVLDGQRVPSIARDLHVGQSTVRTHLAAIFRRLGLHSQDDLVERLRG